MKAGSHFLVRSTGIDVAGLFMYFKLNVRTIILPGRFVTL
jgi:hypothetical protein